MAPRAGRQTSVFADALQAFLGVGVIGHDLQRPLVVGAGDTAAAALGGGLLHDGDAQLTIGTGGQIVVMRAQRPPYEASLNTFHGAAPQPFAQWYVMAAMLNVGSALEWVLELLGYDWAAAYEAATQASPDGVMFLPYLAGERTPLMDAHARGAWLGLTAATSKAAMMRAAFGPSVAIM